MKRGFLLLPSDLLDSYFSHTTLLSSVSQILCNSIIDFKINVAQESFEQNQTPTNQQRQTQRSGPKFATPSLTHISGCYRSYFLQFDARVAVHGIDNTTTAVQMSLTVPLPFEAITTVLLFMVVDDLPQADIVLGSQWHRWSRKKW